MRIIQIHQRIHDITSFEFCEHWIVLSFKIKLSRHKYEIKFSNYISLHIPLRKSRIMFDITGVTFVKVRRVKRRRRRRRRGCNVYWQAAGLVSPLRDAWQPGGEDDKETQEIVSRMLAEIRRGGEEVTPWTVHVLNQLKMMTGLQELRQNSGRLHWKYCSDYGGDRGADYSYPREGEDYWAEW